MALTENNRVDLDRQIAYSGMDADSSDILQMVQPTILSALPGILEQFYERTMAAPELAEKFGSAGNAAFARPPRRSTGRSCSRATSTPNYQDSARRIGFTHHRIGLTPQWYVSGYAFVLGELLSAVAVAQSSFLSTAGMPQDAWRNAERRQPRRAARHGSRHVHLLGRPVEPSGRKRSTS